MVCAARPTTKLPMIRHRACSQDLISLSDRIKDQYRSKNSTENTNLSKLLRWELGKLHIDGFSFRRHYHGFGSDNRKNLGITKWIDLRSVPGSRLCFRFVGILNSIIMGDPEKASMGKAHNAAKPDLDGTITVALTDEDVSSTEQRGSRGPPSLKIKILAILMVSAISFGSQWSSGVTGAMKSTIKKV
jgi:hypothetical protein